MLSKKSIMTLDFTRVNYYLYVTGQIIIVINTIAKALHMAAANGHLDIVEYLISQRVDLNASNEEKNTPLHWACLNGRIEVVKKLILAGASLSTLNCHERTPVDEAISQGKMDVLMQLMQL
ncbi:hypothetical protein GH714_035817 [Hevea brasiliensis]|uniref:Uncharacterized protein n=1 Tax=Hevea brasiliensis TaxID=3981 RepID=A0A6A6KS52_HEVBR|nr:hypothetical protein GH714_035817 [Hevea brasiliensis]